MDTDVGLRRDLSVVDVWQQRLERLNYSPHTIKHYTTCARRFFRYHAGVPLERLTPEHIERFLYDRGLSAVSFSTQLENLRSFFDWLITQQRLLKENPCAGIERPRTQERWRPAPPQTEYERIRAQCQTIEEATIVNLLYFAGPRISELRAFRIEDVDLEQRRARIIAGKGGKDRIVIYPQHVGDLLRAHIAERTEGWVFLTQSPRHLGRRRTADWIEVMLRRLGQQAGLRYPLTAHILRHGWVRLMKVRGVPVEVTARLAGHANIHTTVRIYGRMDDDDLQTVYDRHIETATSEIAALRKSVAMLPEHLCAVLADYETHLRGIYTNPPTRQAALAKVRSFLRDCPDVSLDAITLEQIDRHVASLLVATKTKGEYRLQLLRFLRYRERTGSGDEVPAGFAPGRREPGRRR